MSLCGLSTDTSLSRPGIRTPNVIVQEFPSKIYNYSAGQEISDFMQPGISLPLLKNLVFASIPSQLNPIHLFKLFSPRSVLISPSNLHLRLLNVLFSLGLSNKIWYAFLFSLCLLHVRQSDPTRCNNSNNTRCRFQITRLISKCILFSVNFYI